MEVFNDSEFRRIEALPRRPQKWSPDQEAEAVRLLTAHFRTATGKQTLKPIQARVIVEAHDTGKLVGMCGAGAGKTLCTALLPKIWGAKRTLILVPAFLRNQTFDVWDEMALHWQVPPLLSHDERSLPGQSTVRVVSYESLGTIGFASFLEEYDPDLILADEAHFLQNRKAGRSKRVYRFIKTKRRRGEPIRFVPLTGTFWRKSIKEAAYLFEAALESGSPLPSDWTSLEQWSFAIDQGVKEDLRYGPGALLRLCSAEEQVAGLDGLRRAIQRRIVETPGVVATSEVSCGLPLIFQVRDITVPIEVRAAMRELRTDYKLPTGDEVEPGVTFWNHAREIAAGFAYRWDPPAPPPWREARSAWTRFVREAMDRPGKRHLDTPLQVWNAVEAGSFGAVPEWDAWRAIRDTFEPKTVPYWISPYLVRDAEQWALQHKGIVWVSHTSAYQGDEADDQIGGAFKEIPYFGAGDERIKTYKGPCAASMRSHGTGKNLTQWSEALILGFPSSGKTLEQLAARHHREKQQADIVRFHFYLHSLETFNALKTSLADARFLEDTTGQPQRILTASLLDSAGHRFDVGRFEADINPEDPMWG